MIRKFSKLNDIATLINDGDKKAGVVPYGSRTVGTNIQPKDEFEFEISSASKGLYYYKQQTDSIKAVGLYDDGDEPTTKLSFETAPFNYSDLTEKQEEEVEDREIPLFKFVNIESRRLRSNEVYLTADVDIDLNVGDVVRTNPKGSEYEHDNYNGKVFEITSDVVFDSHYVVESDGSLEDRYFDFDFYEEGETEYDPVTYKYDINLYIAEKRVDGDNTYYTIKDKATSTINAYFLGSVNFHIDQGDQEYGVDRTKIFIGFYEDDDLIQDVCWSDAYDNENPTITHLLYGHNYRVNAYSEDRLLVIDYVGSSENNIQDTTVNYPQDIEEIDKGLAVGIINNHIKPVENVFVRDEASDIQFDLFKMSGEIPTGTILEGQSLEIGQTYSVAFSMMPLSQNSDIYINGDLVASSVKYYGFTLTDDLVVDNQVVIKVVKTAVELKSIINNLDRSLKVIPSDGQEYMIQGGEQFSLNGISEFKLIIYPYNSMGDISSVKCSGTIKGSFMGQTSEYVMDNTEINVDTSFSRGAICLPTYGYNGWTFPTIVTTYIDSSDLVTDLVFSLDKSVRRIVSVTEDSDSGSYVYLRCPTNKIDVSKIPEGFEWGYSEDDNIVNIEIHSGQSLNLGEVDFLNAFEVKAYLNNSYENKVYATGEIDKPSVSYQETFDNDQLEVALEPWDKSERKWFYFNDTNVNSIPKDLNNQNTYDMTFKIITQSI